MNVISAWDVYWVMQLDSIGGLFGAMAIVGTILAAVVFCFSPFWADEDLVDAKWRKWFVLGPLSVLFVGGVGHAFIPSTKTAAAMIVLPAVANSETVQTEAADLYRLAKKALADAVGEEPEAAQ